jgi:hypothetical protein
MNHLALFSRQVRARTAENRLALEKLRPARTYGAIIGILRQELDSMVRVIYLLSVEDRTVRASLIDASVEGRIWYHHGTRRRITDREMVDLANSLHGWTRSVYRFGCAFIHLSSFHDYDHRNPLAQIPAEERAAILEHMRYYHGGPLADHPTFEELACLLPCVFEKVASNLAHYILDLEKDEDLNR